MLKQIYAFNSSASHYHDAVCIVWCFDDRFSPLLQAYIKDQKFAYVDLVKVAGGAKALAGDASPERDFVLGQIKTSIRLHGTNRVILMLHRDCGAYGGSKEFKEEAAKKTYFTEQLEFAKKFLEKEVLIPVTACFGDFDGLYENI